jgi:peptide/nickel transport system substrate-binding protein
MLLGAGHSAVYPCHVSAKDMRAKPVGTGPFKFVEFNSNVSIKLARNPDYWKKGRPYLDAIEVRIIESRATRMLAFVSGEFDLTFDRDVTVPMFADVRAHAPKAVCEFAPLNVSASLIVNPGKPPFDQIELRQAMALALDRKAFIDILEAGEGRIGAAMLPAPEGQWAMPPEELVKLPGYGSDLAANIAEAQRIMQSLGYGPDNPLKVKVSTRNIATYRDPAVILIDQLKKIYIDGELETIETSVYFSKVQRKDYAIGLNQTGVSLDDPDANLIENFACKSERNYTQYCNPEVEKLLFEQSKELDPAKRKALVWEAERKLALDVARPVIHHNVRGTCWHSHVKGIVLHRNSAYNNWRLEDVWLDK